MNITKKFQYFLESLKDGEQDRLIESIRMGFQACLEADEERQGSTVKRGNSTYHYYLTVGQGGKKYTLRVVSREPSGWKGEMQERNSHVQTYGQDKNEAMRKATEHLGFAPSDETPNDVGKISKAEDNIIRFRGKHSGKQVEEVPDDYLLWLYDNFYYSHHEKGTQKKFWAYLINYLGSKIDALKAIPVGDKKGQSIADNPEDAIGIYKWIKNKGVGKYNTFVREVESQLMDTMKQKETSTLNSVASGEAIIPFGKHNGTKIKDLPQDYLKFIHEKMGYGQEQRDYEDYIQHGIGRIDSPTIHDEIRDNITQEIKGKGGDPVFWEGIENYLGGDIPAQQEKKKSEEREASGIKEYQVGDVVDPKDVFTFKESTSEKSNFGYNQYDTVSHFTAPDGKLLRVKSSHGSFGNLNEGDKVNLKTAIKWAKGNVMYGGGRGTKVLGQVS